MSKRRAEAQRWFHQSFFDPKAARWNFGGKCYDTSCFLAQQSGEKALKAILYYVGSRKSALMSHSLVDMIQRVSGNVSEIDQIIEEARILDLHYIPSRYPNALPAGYPHQFYGPETAEKAISAAQKIMKIAEAYFRSRGEDELVGIRE
jgi:HEPN domain-containing protein